jgi:hypothetical protein
VLRKKFQNPNPKSQTISNFQVRACNSAAAPGELELPAIGTHARDRGIGVWDLRFGICLDFGLWDLEFRRSLFRQCHE